MNKRKRGDDSETTGIQDKARQLVHTVDDIDDLYHVAPAGSTESLAFDLRDRKYEAQKILQFVRVAHAIQCGVASRQQQSEDNERFGRTWKFLRMRSERTFGHVTVPRLRSNR
mmetsp:Transcript_34380/g.79360  ORF Transcript_34380/g.79360 Transcript_34380/m.79360 type:complete len:113 (+) Transcript_34380:384-722(+)